MKNKIQVLPFMVVSANQKIKIEEVTDIKHTLVKDMFVTISDENAKAQSTLEFSVDSEEILPSGFGVGIISTTQALSYNDVLIGVNEAAKGSKIKGEYIDSGAAAYPYKVNIYLLTEQE